MVARSGGGVNASIYAGLWAVFGLALPMRKAQVTAGRVVAVCTLISAPLLSGTLESTWTPVWVLSLSIAVLLMGFQPISARRARQLVPVLGAAGLFAAVVWAQVDLEVAPLIGHPAWLETAQLLNANIPSRLGTRAYVIAHDLLLPQAALLAFVACYLAASEGRAAELIVKLLLATSTAIAGYSILEVLLDSKSGGAQNVLTFPFQNRNHAATYYGTYAAIFLAFGLRQIETTDRRGVVSLISTVGPVFWTYIFGYLTCVTALL